ncbi:cytochrome c oxidase subunit II [Roseomonas xinghualingensis]|uniref:cytochrome c oxidase subunit II n=1 Tax=Roseomonas xinghualingensis TaxID=2986475 RepID=UPI0021F18C2D|nr:cytochrome c oxidase subunit II [Roseomonas sp. SXEYE001]MCV4208394.1 cytochrome c oxidase subunit II [Roseomonas sp. SXEYE001]
MRLLLLPLLALAGCSGVQTPLDPWGIQAERIADLTYVLFWGGAVVFLITMGFLALAILAPSSLRRGMGSRRFLVAMGIVFPVTVLTALLVYSLGVSRALTHPMSESPLRIEIIGRQYWWEFRYPDLGEGAVTANALHLPVGREVELHLTSGDVIHSVWVPNLHGKLDMIPGRVNRQRLRADRVGVLRGQCAEFCGTQHTLMAFDVVVQEPAEFDAWIARQRAPVPEPQTDEHRRGMQVFGEAGCGACHAVRGTPWAARIAPDLSRVGSRPTLAGGALPNNRGNLAGWIAAPQDIKPGNNMPAYARALEGSDLLALASWLESLR